MGVAPTLHTREAGVPRTNLFVRVFRTRSGLATNRHETTRTARSPPPACFPLRVPSCPFVAMLLSARTPLTFLSFCPPSFCLPLFARTPNRNELATNRHETTRTARPLNPGRLPFVSLRDLSWLSCLAEPYADFSAGPLTFLLAGGTLAMGQTPLRRIEGANRAARVPWTEC